MNSYLNMNSIAILLLCSQIGLNLVSNMVKPLTIRQWADISERLMNSPMKSPEALFNTTEDDWKANLNLKPEEITKIKTLLSRAPIIEDQLDQLQRIGIYLTTTAERDYPEKLKVKLQRESPPVLYCSGKLDILQGPTLVIFGATYEDAESMKFAKLLAEKCAAQGYTVLTGGTTAIDSIVEEHVLKRGGKAAYILSYDYTKKVNHENLQGAISSGSLLLMSADHPRAALTQRSSIDKNRYLYGLADYAVVVAAENRQGITYNTALENLEKHWSHLFVRKSDNMPEGNAALLELGAEPLASEILMGGSFDLREFSS